MNLTLPDETKPARAARRFCLDCQGGHTGHVRACADEACPLFHWRLADTPPFHPDHGRVLRAIRRNCLVCAGDRSETRRCDAGKTCPLWQYRFGVHPATYQRVMGRRTAPKALWLPGFEP